MSLADDLRAQLDKIKPKPEQIYSIHNKIRTLTNRFDTPGPDMREVLDFDVVEGQTPEGAPLAPIPVRLYIPKGAAKAAGPCLIYLHGGGFVTCSMDSHEGLCLRMAQSSKMRVLSVDYRLAPQHAYPAGPDDCEAVLNWAFLGEGLQHGIDPARLGIGGDSAGGNMAAYLAQKYRQKIQAQVLLYPLMQMAEIEPAKLGPQDMLRLGVVALNFIKKHYVVDANVNDTRISPLFEKDLSGMPPAFVLTCGLDPLRIEGNLYVDNLRANGGRVHHVYARTMPHGFLNFSRAFPKAKTIPVETGVFLKNRLRAKLG